MCRTRASSARTALAAVLVGSAPGSFADWSAAVLLGACSACCVSHVLHDGRLATYELHAEHAGEYRGGEGDVAEGDLWPREWTEQGLRVEHGRHLAPVSHGTALRVRHLPHVVVSQHSLVALGAVVAECSCCQLADVSHGCGAVVRDTYRGSLDSPPRVYMGVSLSIDMAALQTGHDSRSERSDSIHFV